MVDFHANALSPVLQPVLAAGPQAEAFHRVDSAGCSVDLSGVPSTLHIAALEVKFKCRLRRTCISLDLRATVLPKAPDERARDSGSDVFNTFGISTPRHQT